MFSPDTWKPIPHRLAVGLLLIGALVAMGCAGRYGPVYEPRAYPTVTVPAGWAVVWIDDLRTDVVEPRFHVPTMTLPGQGQDASPPLPSNLDLLFLEELEPRLSGTGEGLYLDVEVLEASAGWGANFVSENVHAHVKIRVTVRETEDAEPLLQAVGQSWGKWKGFDTHASAIPHMFVAVLVDAFRDFLVGDDRIAEIRRRLAPQAALD